MTAEHPTPDDLRTLAKNLKHEGFISRAEVLNNAADELDIMRAENDRLILANKKLADSLHELRAVLDGLK